MKPLKLPDDGPPPLLPLILHVLARTWPHGASIIAGLGLGLGVAKVPPPPVTTPDETAGRWYTKGYRQGIEDGVAKGRDGILAELDMRDPDHPIGLVIESMRGPVP